MDDVCDEDYVDVFKSAGFEINDKVLNVIKIFRICHQRDLYHATLIQAGLYDYTRLLESDDAKYEDIRAEKTKAYFSGEYDKDEEELNY